MLLGHKDLKVTRRYVHMAGKTDHLNEAMELACTVKPNKQSVKKST